MQKIKVVETKVHLIQVYWHLNLWKDKRRFILVTAASVNFWLGLGLSRLWAGDRTVHRSFWKQSWLSTDTGLGIWTACIISKSCPQTKQSRFLESPQQQFFYSGVFTHFLSQTSHQRSTCEKNTRNASFFTLISWRQRYVFIHEQINSFADFITVKKVLNVALDGMFQPTANIVND